MSIPIILVDDHALFRDGLQSLLEEKPNFEVIAEAANDHELKKLLEQHKGPVVVLLDVSLKGSESGVELANYIRQYHKQARIIALTMHDDEATVMQMVQARVDGYLLKNAAEETLYSCIEAVSAGGTYFQQEVSQVLFNQLLSPQGNHTPERVKHPESTDREWYPDVTGEKQVHLTKREKQIIRYVAKEYTSRQIADDLQLSVRTVDNYRYKLMCKLNAKATAGIVRYAMKHGLA